MLQAYISNDNQHLKRLDKRQLTRKLLGNAALSLEWVECRRKMSAEAFIYSVFSSHVRLLLGAPS